MENSLKEKAANPDAMEKQLRLLRIELFSLAVAFPDPASAYKFQMEHLENFGYEADVRKFGYPSMDEFLSDHPRLDTVFIDDRKCYRAKFEEKTADIQNMVAKQKKKKRIKKNFRSNFDRTVTFKRTVLQSKTFSARSGMKPFEYARTSLRVTATASPVVPMHLIGIQRFMLALKSCNGTATLTRLNKAYLHLYKVQFDKCELIKHFGTRNLSDIFARHFVGLAELKVVYGSQYMFISQENIEKQKDWSIAHNQVVKPEKVHCEIPSLAKLYLNVVAMLEDMHPFTIQLKNMTEIYQRNYKVLVDPEKAYCKSWRQLVSVTFKEKLQLMSDDSVRLSDAYLTLHEITSKIPAISRVSPKKVTAVDLGLEISSSDFDEDDDSYYDDSTSESASVSLSCSGSFTPLPDTYVSCNINSSPEKQTQLVASNISSFARCDPLIKSSKIPKIHSTIFPTEEDRSLRNEILLKKNTKDVQDKYNTFGKDPLDRFRLSTANDTNYCKNDENVGAKLSWQSKAVASSSIESALVYSTIAEGIANVNVEEIHQSSYKTTSDLCTSSLTSSDAPTKMCQTVDSGSTKPKGFGFGGKVKGLLGLRGLSKFVKQIPKPSSTSTTNETTIVSKDHRPLLPPPNDSIAGMKNISNEYLANRKSLEQAADKRIRTEELGESSESICKRTQVHIPNSYFNVRAVNLGGKAQAKAAEIKRSMMGATILAPSLPPEAHV